MLSIVGMEYSANWIAEEAGFACHRYAIARSVRRIVPVRSLPSCRRHGRWRICHTKCFAYFIYTDLFDEKHDCPVMLFYFSIGIRVKRCFPDFAQAHCTYCACNYSAREMTCNRWLRLLVIITAEPAFLNDSDQFLCISMQSCRLADLHGFFAFSLRRRE